MYNVIRPTPNTANNTLDTPQTTGSGTLSGHWTSPKTSGGADVGYPINDYWKFPQPIYQTTTTTNLPVTSDDIDTDVTIEKVDNGFIISRDSDNSVLVALDMVQLTQILTDLFEEKKK